MKLITRSVVVTVWLLLQAASAHAETVDLSHAELASKLAKDPNTIIVDVRSAAEYQRGHVPNAINIAHGDILENVSLLDQYKDKDLVFYCRSGVRAGKVTQMLNNIEFNQAKPVYHLNGDMLAWEAANQAIEK